MDTRARHLLAEYHGCDPAVLDDPVALEALLRAAAVAARVRPMEAQFRRLAPQGVSGVIVIEESHLSIHTWPEAGYAAADFFTCGAGRPEAAHALLEEGLRSARADVLLIERGLPGPGPSLRVARA
jgi:S-adenosylmethionine decarboxylase